MPVAVRNGGAVRHYREELETACEAVFIDEHDRPVAVRSGTLTYCGGWGDDELLDRLIADVAPRAGIVTMPMPRGVRTRNTATERFWFNYNPHAVETPAGVIPAAGVLRMRL